MLFKHAIEIDYMEGKRSGPVDPTSVAMAFVPVVVFFWFILPNLGIKIIISLLLILVIVKSWNSPVILDDSIIVEKNSITIVQNSKTKIIEINQVDSIKSKSGLTIKMKNGEKTTISYSSWKLSFEKAKELQAILQQLIEENTSEH